MVNFMTYDWKNNFFIMRSESMPNLRRFQENEFEMYVEHWVGFDN